MSLNKNLLLIILILCACLNWDCSEGAQEKESGDVNFHTIQLDSLFPSSSSCVLSPKASNTKSSLHVLHMHGPCSPGSSDNAPSPDHDDILRRDQGRVDSIHSKLLTDRLRPSQSTELLAKQWGTGGSGTYIVKIGIGTPKRDLSLMFDTGSDLTWIQCQPCGRSCYSQKEPIFNPSSSSSFSNVSCSSNECSLLKSKDSVVSGCLESNCGYRIKYGDTSFSNGFLAKERFTLTSSDVFDGFNFGCGKDNHKELFFRVAGLLSLGRGDLSLPSQTANTYNNIFSYCLPSSSSSYTGHLTFGSAGISSSLKFTPISSFPDPSFYGLSILGISVGHQKLEIPLTVFSKPGAIIDSGTVITRLPPMAYQVLKRVFKEQMLMLNHTTTSSTKTSLDTCYNFAGFMTANVPKITFSFSGDAIVELDTKGILYPIDRSLVCLAFAANSNDREAIIFGNVQQTTLQVVYDGPGQRIGFAPNGCS